VGGGPRVMRGGWRVVEGRGAGVARCVVRGARCAGHFECNSRSRLCLKQIGFEGGSRQRGCIKAMLLPVESLAAGDVARVRVRARAFSGAPPSLGSGTIKRVASPK
jgi:hypothetical protein